MYDIHEFKYAADKYEWINQLEGCILTENTEYIPEIYKCLLVKRSTQI